MEHLPYIDEHATIIPADRATVWTAVLRTLCRNPEDPSTVPFGFTLDVAEPLERFALKGRHWFSVYKLIFLLAEADSGTRVTAQTWAAFPGLKGNAYRALVIGSGAHRIVVRRMLKRIAAQTTSASMQSR
jgi:hypothetical protein